MTLRESARIALTARGRHLRGPVRAANAHARPRLRRRAVRVLRGRRPAGTAELRRRTVGLGLAVCLRRLDGRLRLPGRQLPAQRLLVLLGGFLRPLRGCCGLLGNTGSSYLVRRRLFDERGRLCIAATRCCSSAPTARSWYWFGFASEVASIAYRLRNASTSAARRFHSLRRSAPAGTAPSRLDHSGCSTAIVAPRSSMRTGWRPRSPLIRTKRPSQESSTSGNRTLDAAWSRRRPKVNAGRRRFPRQGSSQQSPRPDSRWWFQGVVATGGCFGSESSRPNASAGVR